MQNENEHQTKYNSDPKGWEIFEGLMPKFRQNLAEVLEKGKGDIDAANFTTYVREARAKKHQGKGEHSLTGGLRKLENSVVSASKHAESPRRQIKRLH